MRTPMPVRLVSTITCKLNKITTSRDRKRTRPSKAAFPIRSSFKKEMSSLIQNSNDNIKSTNWGERRVLKETIQKQTMGERTRYFH